MEFDLLVIGAGINGAAIGADAAGRGLRVLICDRGDLGGATSSQSSKLIHGGLRYLAQGHFTLVRESLQERYILQERAPHLVYPLTFILPDSPWGKPVWLTRLGLELYDHLGGASYLEPHRRLNLATLSEGALLKNTPKGFIYQDCWGDDSRLVVANLQLAAKKGASIQLRTTFLGAVPENQGWRVDLLSITGEKQSVLARCLVNASGPYADQVCQSIIPDYQPCLSLVKGSHLIVRAKEKIEKAFILPTEDKRIIFVLPYENDFLLIGTTDEAITNMNQPPSISDQEKAYLLKIYNHYFKESLSQKDIVSTFSGVRALYDNPRKRASRQSREAHLELSSVKDSPLLTVYGGKLTVHRLLAEKAVNLLQSYFPSIGPAWTAQTPLPNGQLGKDFNAFLNQIKKLYPSLSESFLHRMVHAYGEGIYALLDSCQLEVDLGECFGADLYEQEVRYLVANEWAQTAEDILWRRTKLGLRMEPKQVEHLNNWLKDLHFKG